MAKVCRDCDPPVEVESAIRTCDMDEDHEGFECPKCDEWYSENEWDELEDLKDGELLDHPTEPEHMLPAVAEWFKQRVGMP